jgi:hypothetical protein
MREHNDWGLLTAEHGADFAARVDQVGRDAWRASAHVSLMRIRAILDEDIGPKIFPSERDAVEWLEHAAAERGFSHVAVAVHRVP